MFRLDRKTNQRTQLTFKCVRVSVNEKNFILFSGLNFTHFSNLCRSKCKENYQYFNDNH